MLVVQCAQGTYARLTRAHWHVTDLITPTGALLECNKGRSRVWVRSADLLNNSFDTGAPLSASQAKGVLVLHFKGHLKAHMRPRFEELCSQHGQTEWCASLDRVSRA